MELTNIGGCKIALGFADVVHDEVQTAEVVTQHAESRIRDRFASAVDRVPREPVRHKGLREAAVELVEAFDDASLHSYITL